jgi:hypothetical protein
MAAHHEAEAALRAALAEAPGVCGLLRSAYAAVGAEPPSALAAEEWWSNSSSSSSSPGPDAADLERLLSWLLAEMDRAEAACMAALRWVTDGGSPRLDHAGRTAALVEALGASLPLREALVLVARVCRALVPAALQRLTAQPQGAEKGCGDRRQQRDAARKLRDRLVRDQGHQRCLLARGEGFAFCTFWFS